MLHFDRLLAYVNTIHSQVDVAAKSFMNWHVSKLTSQDFPWCGKKLTCLHAERGKFYKILSCNMKNFHKVCSKVERLQSYLFSFENFSFFWAKLWPLWTNFRKKVINFSQNAAAFLECLFWKTTEKSSTCCRCRRKFLAKTNIRKYSHLSGIIKFFDEVSYKNDWLHLLKWEIS